MVVAEGSSTGALWWIVLPNGQRFSAANDAQLAQWAREGRFPMDAVIESEGGWRVQAGQHPAVQAAMGPQAWSSRPPQPADAAVSTLIPYKNVPALIGYYTGVFSLIPLFGLVLGPVALIFGIFGLRAVAKNPSAKGRVHAWVGIVLGGLVSLAYVVGAVAITSRD